GYVLAPAESIDTDQDGTDEVSISDGKVFLDGNDDGVATGRERVIPNSVDYGFYCQGDALDAMWFHASGATIETHSSNYGGRPVCSNYTGAGAGNDSIMGMAKNAATIIHGIDMSRYNQFGASIAVRETSAYLGAVGFLTSSTNQNALTLDMGCYFYCCPACDIDGDGTTGDGGDTDDDHWWAVCQNGDTDSSGDLCDTTSGSPVQCATYQATNTTAWNTDVDCENIYEFHVLEMEIDAAAANVSFYVDGALETTMSTNIPASYVYAPVVWWEAQEAVDKRVFVDWIEVNHDR
ncbi:MAG: hypothetical protein ACYSWU_19745, partial [Planctomycetota bacterium]